MTYYIITKEGVYRHEILGLFDDEEKAWQRAESECINEYDDYHEFHISKIVLNENCKDVEYIGHVKKEGYEIEWIVDEKKQWVKNIKSLGSPLRFYNLDRN